MSFFDLIRDLRTREPDAAKTARVMKAMGWFCILAGAWNSAVLHLLPFDRSPFKIPRDYPSFALATFAIIGALSLLSARGILNREPWGRRLGQAAVFLLVAAVIGYFVVLVGSMNIPSSFIPRPVLIIFSIFFFGQIVVPAWFGIRYLGRLPVEPLPQEMEARYNNATSRSGSGVNENAFVLPDRRAVTGTHPRESAPAPHPAAPDVRYKDSPSPLGVGGTFIVLLAVPLAAMMIAQTVFGPQAIAVLVIPLFLPIFVGPVLYNRSVSPFERERGLVASYTGGGSIFLFNGTWPFFRLLVYADGVEIRVMFHRFFIPYDRMEDLPEKPGLFSSGVPFRSGLPEVPSSIRFYGFRSKGVLEAVREQRDRYLAAGVPPGPAR